MGIDQQNTASTAGVETYDEIFKVRFARLNAIIAFTVVCHREICINTTDVIVKKYTTKRSKLKLTQATKL